MLGEAEVLSLLAPFKVKLTPPQLTQIMTYLDLLLRWNLRINLTAIRNAEDCVTRHFGESLYLATRLALTGRLLDIGTGAGFPGLPLKIAFPDLETTLLEPVAKKRAFLKEVVQACGMRLVDVRAERVEDLNVSGFRTVVARAVGRLERLVPAAARCIEPGGRLCLWLSRNQAKIFANLQAPIGWASPITIPDTRELEIWVGHRLE